jgi:hypothetical protein
MGEAIAPAQQRIHLFLGNAPRRRIAKARQQRHLRVGRLSG